MNEQFWERLGKKKEPSWYLDPITARQKRDAHLKVIREWMKGIKVNRILKTDLFEEAFGEDSLLELLFPGATLVCGLDAAFSTARNALRRHRQKISSFACDVRHLGLQDCSIDLIVSTSTLDHFDVRGDFLAALAELARVLRPGGLLVITLDNLWNPLYPLLRWLSVKGVGPYPLGYTPSATCLEKDLRTVGLQPEKRGWLIHNPRAVSTLLFLGLRKLLWRRAADEAIRLLQKVFDWQSGLPTRRFTACFVAMAARKPREGK